MLTGRKGKGWLKGLTAKLFETSNKQAEAKERRPKQPREYTGVSSWSTRHMAEISFTKQPDKHYIQPERGACMLCTAIPQHSNLRVSMQTMQDINT
jgi:hypothetical protein